MRRRHLALAADQQRQRQGPTVAGEYVAVTDGHRARPSGDLFVPRLQQPAALRLPRRQRQLQDVWFDGNHWHLQQINNASGRGPAVAGEYVASPAPAAGEGNLFVCVYDDGQHPTGQHFAYRGAGAGSGDVWDCWWSAPTPSDITVTPTSIIYKHSLDLGADIGNIAGPISLTITSDGSYNFSGQLNNSGKAPYTVNVAVGIESAKGSLFLFTASQSINGNDLFDNNNASWDTTGNNATIKGVWGDLQAGLNYNYQSSNSLDLAAIVSSLESAFQDVQAVITVAAAL